MRSTLILLILSFSLATTTTLLQAEELSVRTVDHASWHMKEDHKLSNILEQNIKPNMASLYFVRPLDKDVIQSSANLAVNGRFQVSLQPGNFTHVYSCAGINQLSAVATHEKTNDLSRYAKTFNVKANENYFFIVNVENLDDTNIQQIDKAQALDLMSSHTYQDHQISRVAPTCKTQNSLELEILFANDQFVVKPQYYAEIEQLAELLANSPEAQVTIEGHTDNNADRLYNQQLSENRANAVKRILVQTYGISANRINAIGYGQSRPIASNSTEAGRQQNRRVMAVFK